MTNTAIRKRADKAPPLSTADIGGTCLQVMTGISVASAAHPHRAASRAVGVAIEMLLTTAEQVRTTGRAPAGLRL